MREGEFIQHTLTNWSQSDTGLWLSANLCSLLVMVCNEYIWVGEEKEEKEKAD